MKFLKKPSFYEAPRNFDIANAFNKVAISKIKFLKNNKLIPRPPKSCSGVSSLDQVNTDTFRVISLHGYSFSENDVHVCYA